MLGCLAKSQDSPGEEWARCWFGMDSLGLRTVRAPASAAGAAAATQPYLTYDLADIAGG